MSAEWGCELLLALELLASKKSFRLLTRLSFSSRCSDARLPSGGGGPLSDGGCCCLKREKSDFMAAAAYVGTGWGRVCEPSVLNQSTAAVEGVVGAVVVTNVTEVTEVVMTGWNGMWV